MRSTAESRRACTEQLATDTLLTGFGQPAGGSASAVPRTDRPERMRSRRETSYKLNMAGGLRGVLLEVMLVQPTLWKLLFWLGVIGVCTISLMPGDVGPLGNGDGNGKPERDYINSRHVAAYFALMAVGYVAYRGPRAAAWVAGALFMLGTSLEVVQRLLPSRCMALSDALSNALGIALAFLIIRSMPWLAPRAASWARAIPGTRPD